MPTIEVNNVTLYYEDRGVGFPLVLVAGFGADHQAWSLILEECARYNRVIVFDNRGAGQSAAPEGAYGVAMMAQDTVALCRALEINEAVFIGSSLGGGIVQHIAANYPTLVRAAVLVNASRKVDIRFALFAKMRLKLLQAGVPHVTVLEGSLGWTFSRQILNTPNFVDSVLKLAANAPHPMTAIGYGGQLQALLNFDSTNWLQDIKAPCLVMGGDQDIIVNVDEVKALAAGIPDAQYYIFKDAAHLPQIEKPNEFCQIMFDFLRQVDNKTEQ